MEQNATAEIFVENWFTENGFQIKEKKHYEKKTRFSVEKDGINDEVILPDKVTDGASFVGLFLRAFNTYRAFQGI